MNGGRDKMFLLFLGPIIGVSIAIIASVVLVSVISGVIASEEDDNE